MGCAIGLVGLASPQPSQLCAACTETDGRCPTRMNRGGTRGKRKPLPDLDAERDAHEFLAWDMEPGDVIAFHALTLHGASDTTWPETEPR